MIPNKMWATQKDGKILLRLTQKPKRNWWATVNQVTFKKIIDFLSQIESWNDFNIHSRLCFLLNHIKLINWLNKVKNVRELILFGYHKNKFDVIKMFFDKFYNHQNKTTNVSFLMGRKRLLNSFLDPYDRYFYWLSLAGSCAGIT